MIVRIIGTGEVDEVDLTSLKNKEVRTAREVAEGQRSKRPKTWTEEAQIRLYARFDGRNPRGRKVTGAPAVKEPPR